MLLELTNSVAASFVATELHFNGRTKYTNGVAAAALLINVLAWLADFSESGLASDALQVFAAHRIAVAMVAFAALVYADAVRLRPELPQRQLFQIFGASLVRTTAWFPVLAIGIAVLFTLASFGTDALGVPHHYLNSFVFYGVFYGPFYSMHYFVKQRVLTEHADALLPV